MPNAPRPDNPARQVRVEDELWKDSDAACKQLGTDRATVMRDALRRIVKRAQRELVKS